MISPPAVAAKGPTEEQALVELRELLQQEGALGNPLAPHLERILNLHEKLSRRFNKIVSISDGYQFQLMDLKARLEVSAGTDLLTGLANRRKMMEQLERELGRAKRHGQIFSVLIADLDHFKRVNDGYGHLAGDRVLKAVADCFRCQLRAEDGCGRWGGEEFLILLPETDARRAGLVAQKLVAAVRQTVVPWEQNLISVTVSIGIGAFSSGMSADACIKVADDALYAAKRQGRNGFALGEGTPWRESE